jgi:hypothetical protein
MDVNPFNTSQEQFVREYLVVAACIVFTDDLNTVLNKDRTWTWTCIQKVTSSSLCRAAGYPD